MGWIEERRSWGVKGASERNLLAGPGVNSEAFKLEGETAEVTRRVTG
jgi:hypothetical protein